MKNHLEQKRKVKLRRNNERREKGIKKID